MKKAFWGLVVSIAVCLVVGLALMFIATWSAQPLSDNLGVTGVLLWLAAVLLGCVAAILGAREYRP